jgi:hypothetical protein
VLQLFTWVEKGARAYPMHTVRGKDSDDQHVDHGVVQCNVIVIVGYGVAIVGYGAVIV